MIRNDYLLSLIEQAAAVLASVVRRKNEGVYDQAIEEIKQACERLTGLSFDVVEVLPPDELIALLSRGGSFDPGRGIVLADLLRENGDICKLQSNGPGAYHRHVSALALYLESLPQLDRSARRIYANRCWEILRELEGYELPGSVLVSLVVFYEREASFARAEDALYDLLDLDFPDIAALGRAFYRRIASRPDEELEKGGLPRAEIEEGLRTWNERTA